MNELTVGSGFDLKPIGHGCLFITDSIPEELYRRAKIFDPKKDRFNPLKGITDESAWSLSEALYTISDGGKDTLTVRKGRLELAKALRASKNFLAVRSDNEEVQGMLEQILFFKTVKDMVSGDEFSLAKNTVVIAHLDRKALGSRVCLIVGLLLLNAYKGQVVVKDFDFYGRDAHIDLIEQGRLMAHVRTLANVPTRLRENLLLIKKKSAINANYKDAKMLAESSGLSEGTEGFSTFIKFAMETPPPSSHKSIKS